jgi:hypothetical protein
LFDVEDVVRLGVLCHLGRSRRNLTELGPKVQDLDLTDRFVIVSEADEVVTQPGSETMIAAVRMPGAYTVCDVATLRDRVRTFVERTQYASDSAATTTELRRAQ